MSVNQIMRPIVTTHHYGIKININKNIYFFVVRRMAKHTGQVRAHVVRSD